MLMNAYLLSFSIFLVSFDGQGTSRLSSLREGCIRASKCGVRLMVVRQVAFSRQEGYGTVKTDKYFIMIRV